jgi:hypothetical protein
LSVLKQYAGLHNVHAPVGESTGWQPKLRSEAEMQLRMSFTPAGLQSKLRVAGGHALLHRTIPKMYTLFAIGRALYQN